MYSLLMLFAKSLTGIWMMILPTSTKFVQAKTPVTPNVNVNVKSKSQPNSATSPATELSNLSKPNTQATSSEALSPQQMPTPVASNTNTPRRSTPDENQPPTPTEYAPIPPAPRSTHKNFYPALLLGLAMTTRGEIGFLIAAVAQTSSVIGPEEVYLVVIWAIMLCTLLGPIGVGIIVKRIERVSNDRGGRNGVLGGWGEPETSELRAAGGG